MTPRRIFGILMLLIVAAVPAAVPVAAQQRVVPRDRTEISLSFAPLVKRTAPAVVNIYSRKTVQQPRVSLGPFDDPLFRRFFGIPDEDAGPRSRVQQSLGSGVIVDPSGLVVTNHHVIRGADEITVVLNDRREFKAELVRSDARTDLALLRMEGTGRESFPTLPFADSDQVEVGDIVLAIGNPFGVGQSVTNGIVSALARSIGDGDASYFIQTDAPINPGNSGGALIDMSGALIGINTAIFSRSGGSQGIGFAIPSNLVRVMVHGAANGGRVARAWLGGDVQPVTSELAGALGLGAPRGALVRRVASGGPLERAGVRNGDVILSMNGRAIADPGGLHYRLSTETVPGQAMITFWRDGREYSARLPIEAPPENPPRQTTNISGQNPLGGARVANLSPALADEIGFAGRPEGVVVLRVDGLSARTGFAAGDVILTVNGREIRRVDDLVSALRSARRWEVTFRRGDQTLIGRFG